jgi:glycosyltransferase involved in cell wall biosynthesis
MKSIPVRLGVLQRVLPEYRVPFFDMLAENCPKGFCLFAGRTQPGEGILEADFLHNAALFPAHNHYLLGGRTYLVRQSNIMEWLEQWHPDVLVAEASPRIINLSTAIHWMHTRKRKVIGWGLGVTLGRKLPGLKKTFREKFISQFDALLAYSTAGKEAYAGLGFPSEKIFISPNAVTPQPVWKILHRKNQFKENIPTLLFVGRLVKQKRVDILLRACADLKKSMQLRLVIVGDGPDRQLMEMLAAQILPEARFTGDLRGEELAREFREADLFILPGLGGLAVQQAMSYALPIIAAQADGTQADLVRSGNGWQIPSGEVAILADTIRTALENVPRLRRMGGESFRIVSEEINLEAMVEAFAIAIETVQDY